MEKLLHKYQILSKRGFTFIRWSSKLSIRYRGCLVTKLCPTPVTPWTAAHQAPLSSTISQSLLKIMSIESVILFNYLIFCHPLLLLPSISPSIRVFFNELVLCIRWPKYWNLYFSISPSNEYSGLISWYGVWIFPWKQWERFWVFK